jgi:predicted dehydrogenase
MPLIDQFDKGSVMTKEWLAQFGAQHRLKKIIEDTMISDRKQGVAEKVRPVKIGIVGAGAIAQRGHIPEFSSIDGVELVAIADIDRDKAGLVAQKAGIPRVFEDYQDVLSLEGLDAVSVCVPNYLHAAVTVAACDAGKHVLCEKPIATRVEDAQRMIDAAAHNDVILMIEQAKRFTPPVEVAKSLIRTGILGDVLAVRSKFGHWGAHTWSPTGSWFFEKQKSGGGVLIDLGIHHADLIIKSCKIVFTSDGILSHG